MAKKRTGPRVGGLRGLVDGLAGARLCYGEPVVSGERAVIPVARVRVAGGGGWGEGKDEEGAGGGGGGGGYVEATPSGFIEIGADGARYHPIPDPERLGRLVRAAAAAALTLATARRVRAGRERPLLARGAFARRG